MKNLFIVCIVFISGNCFSQSFMENIVNRLHFGVKAGANYSNFTNAGFNTEGLTGFHAGGIMAFEISDKFSIQEEFLFSTQGAKLKGGILDGQELKLSYITVPILLKYRSAMGIYIEAGPQVGILASEDFKKLGINDKFAEKIDAGIAGGIGYQFKNGLGIGARYYYGFTDVSKVTTAGIKPNFQNNMVQASLFYIF